MTNARSEMDRDISPATQPKYSIGLPDAKEPERRTPKNDGNYPPHNIEKLTDTHYQIVMAVAGFSRPEITVSLLSDCLTVRGDKTEDSMMRTIVTDHEDHTGNTIKKIRELPATYVWKGIAFRSFVREFALGENVEIKDARLNDGLLVIDIFVPTRPSISPVTIPIN